MDIGFSRNLLFPFISFLICIVLTPIIISFARRYKIFDLPGFRKVHVRPVPRLGGIGIFIAFWFGWGAYYFFYGEALPYEARIPLLSIFGGSFIVWLLGIADDFWGCSAWQKLAVQSLAAGFVIWGGVNIRTLQNPFGDNVYFLGDELNFVLTFAWLIFVTNAINLIDGLDGLAGGVCMITCLSIAFISHRLGNTYLPLLSLTLAAACFGFLFFNFAPARIFLGDSGSLFLGFMLACFSIFGSTKRSTAIVMFGPPIILALPVLDAVLAILRRFLGGGSGRRSNNWTLLGVVRRIKDIFNADQEHIHHALLRIGLSHRRAVIILYVVTSILGVSAYQIAVKDHLRSTLVTFVFLSLSIIWLRRKAFPTGKNRLKIDL